MNNYTAQCSCGIALFNCLSTNSNAACTFFGTLLATECETLCPDSPNLCPPAPTTISYPVCVGSFCSNTSVCAAPLALGASCEYSDQCGGGFIFGSSSDCTNGVCTAVKRSTGDPCSTSVQCYSGTCTAMKCAGRAAGATCSRDGECLFGYHCTGVCTINVAIGATCSSGSDCGNFAICNNGTCRVPYSVTAGGHCSTDEACTFGTYCGSNQVCLAVSGTPSACIDGSCDHVGENSGCYCNAAGNHLCSQGEGIPASCSSTFTSYMNCLTTNGCQDSSITADLTTCGAVHCLQETSCVLNCYIQSPLGSVFESSCFGSFPSCSDSSDAIFLSFSAALLVSVLAFFF